MKFEPEVVLQCFHIELKIRASMISTQTIWADQNIAENHVQILYI